LFIVPPIGVFVYGTVKSSHAFSVFGMIWLFYNLLYLFTYRSMLVHMYCEMLNVDRLTKAMMEDTEDYYHSGKAYSTMHTYPG